MKNQMIELYNWGEEIFRRIDLELSDVIDKPQEWSVRLRTKDMDMRLGISMASMSPGLELTPEERVKMSTFLDALV